MNLVDKADLPCLSLDLRGHLDSPVFPSSSRPPNIELIYRGIITNSAMIVIPDAFQWAFHRVLFYLTSIVTLLVPLQACTTRANTVTGDQVIATVQPIATDAGMKAFRDGGNAIDAAVGAALMLGVVDQHNSGLGGGCFILIRLANGEVAAIDGRETAPMAATRDMYVRHGKAIPELSQHGPLAVGTPGALAAYDLALRRFGKRTLAQLAMPCAEVAENGFALDPIYARNIRQTADHWKRYAGSRQTFSKPDDSPYVEGDILKQPDLARSYRAIARNGADWFYRGPFAQQTAAWMADNGGILAVEDFRQYVAKTREPIRNPYRGYTLLGFPPPSSGGVHVAQVLNILEPLDLRSIHNQNSTLFLHVTAEAMKFAFADRSYWLGDADFAKVPRGLTSKAYGETLSRRIDRTKATVVPSHSTPPNATTDLFGKHTTHIAAADSEGNWVAITATVNTSLGSKVVIPGTGIVLNNEMDDFSSQPGVPNAFGLVGAESNAIHPGKRPLSSMSPTIVLQGNEPILTVGAAGGPKIITQVIMTLIRHLDLGMPIDRAVAAKRHHHQWSPDVLFVEDSFPDSEVTNLKSLGHKIERRVHVGVTQAIVRSKNNESLVAVNDPRVPGKAAGRVREHVEAGKR